MKILDIKKEQKNAFIRITLAAVLGMSIGHLFNFKSSIVFSLFSLKLMFRPGRFDYVFIIKSLSILALGMKIGLFIGNVSIVFPFATSILMFMFFLFILDCNRTNRFADHSYDLLLVTTFASINSSYPNSAYYISINQYLLQTLYIFMLLLILHVLFPSDQEPPKPKQRKETNISTLNLFLDTIILYSFWLFSMLFEWRFAFFAFITIASLYENYDYEMILLKCKANIKIHTLACLSASIFSLVLFSMTGNWLLFSLGLFLIYSPFIYRIIYLRENLYFNTAFIFGLTVPLSIYLNVTDVAILYKSQLRAFLICGTMLITMFFIKLRKN